MVYETQDGVLREGKSRMKNRNENRTGPNLRTVDGELTKLVEDSLDGQLIEGCVE